MDHLDKLIPLAILGVGGAFLVFLVRRVMRESAPAPIAAAPVPAEVSVAPTVDAPAEPAIPRIEPVVVVVAPPAPRKKRRPKPKPATPTPSEQTPIAKVVELLRDKDTLAAAFLLHEILAPPVSKRH